MVFIKNIYGGGAQTNANGLKFEQETKLEDAINNTDNFKVINDEVYDILDNKMGILLQKNKLYKYLFSKGIDWKLLLSKRMFPDDCFYNFTNNTIYIIEKKFQNCSGSVDEKLQGCDFKLRQYKKLLKSLNVNIRYIYLFNDWFLKKEYDDVKEYILDIGCSYYFNEIPLEKLGLDK